jgi:DNA invertase Pin-like site-specific DNA recombinase
MNSRKNKHDRPRDNSGLTFLDRRTMKKFRRINDDQREEIRTLTLEGVAQAEICRRLKIYRGTVRRVQLSFNLPTRLVIVPEEQIRKLHQEGKTQKEIAELTGTSRGTVYRLQKRMNLCAPYRGERLPLSPSEAGRVLALLRRGLSTRQVCIKLNMREHAVRIIREKNHIVRKTLWESVPPATQAKILEEIMERRNRGCDLAEKYGVSYKVILRVAHRELGCPKFRSGATEPLSSNFPQKHFGKSRKPR